MIKWVLALMMVVTMGQPVFSGEVRDELQDWQIEALFSIGYGNAHLLSNEPWQALNYFQKASSCIDKSDSSSGSIGFLITFSQIIAYDCLGFHDLCRQSIGSLFLAINAYDDDGDSSSDEDDSTSEKEENSSATIEFFQSLASVAPSPEVRSLLFSLIEDIAEELFPAGEFLDQKS